MVWELAGRRAELASVASLLAESPGVVVHAQPGVGSSRFLQEAGEQFRAEGRDVVLVSASEALRSLPFGALAGVLPSLAPTGPARDAAGRSSDEVVRAVAGVRGRFRGRAGVVLIDNAIHLDGYSIELILGVLAEKDVNVVWVLSLSPLAAAPERLASLWQSGTFAMMRLDALMPLDFGMLATAATGLPIPEVLATSLHRGCRGSVRLLHEYVEGAREVGAVIELAGDGAFGPGAHTSPRFCARVNADLAALPGPLREALDLVAVAEGIPLAMASALLDEGRTTELERLGLLEVHLQEWHLATALYVAALVSELSPRRRQHLLAGLVADQELDSLTDVQLLRAAEWDAKGFQVLPADHLLRAIGIAVELHRPRLARSLFTIAMGRNPYRSTDQQFDLDLAELGVTAAEGDVLLALRKGQALMSESEGNPRRMEASSRALSSLVHRFEIGSAATLEVLEDLFLATGESSGSVGVRLLHAQVLLLSGRLGIAQELVASIDTAELSADDRPTLFIISALTNAAGGDAIRALDAVEAFARESGLGGSHPTSHLIAVSAALAGSLGGLRGRGLRSTLLQMAEAQPELTGSLTAIGAFERLTRGWLADASALAVASLDRLSRFDPLRLAAVPRLVLAFNQGLGARPTLDVAEGTELWTPLTGLIRMWASLDWAAKNGLEPDGAARQCAQFDETGWPTAARFGLHLLARYGWADRAVPGLMSMTGTDAAGEQNDVVGYVLEDAQARLQRDPVRLMEVSKRFVEIGWTASAVDALREAGQLFDEMDEPHQRMIAAIAEGRLMSVVDEQLVLSRYRAGAALSVREAELMAAVANGERSKSIAARLGLSPRTIDNHLYRLYRRFELSGRGDLTTLAQWVETNHPKPQRPGDVEPPVDRRARLGATARLFSPPG